MDYGFRAYDIYCIQKKIYFSSVDYNALMEIDLKKNICSCIQVFNKENYDQKNLLDYIEKSSSDNYNIEINNYLDNASTYIYTFHKQNDKYIFDSLKRIN